MSNILLDILGRGFEHVQRIVNMRFQEVPLTAILSGGRRGRRKITGHILHIKRATPISTKILTRRRIKDEFVNYSSTYYRMLYVRVETSMCVIIIRQDEVASLLYAESRLAIGAAVTVLEPHCNGYWNELPVLATNHPLMPVTVLRQPALESLPDGMVSSGNMVSFCIEVERLNIISIDFTKACSHTYCDARYGDQCPRCISSKGCIMLVPQVHFEVPDHGYEWVPYASKELALSVFSAELLVVPQRKDVEFMAMGCHMTEVLEAHRGFRLMGWYRPEVRKEDVVTQKFKLHTSKMTLTGDVLQRYELAPENETEHVSEEETDDA